MAAIRRRQSGAGGNASIMSSGPVKGAQDSQTDVKEKPRTTRVCRATSLSQWRCGARVAVPNAASFRRQRNALQPSAVRGGFVHHRERCPERKSGGGGKSG